MGDIEKTEKTLDEFSEQNVGTIKVLVVEDDPFLSEIVAAQLLKTGCTPYTTDNGDEALVLVERHAPHVIILDLMLPGMPGEQVLETLKSHGKHKKIPVIVFSNRSESADIKKLMGMGASAFFVKIATQPDDLSRMVKKLARDAAAAI